MNNRVLNSFLRIHAITKQLKIPVYKPKTLRVANFTTNDVENDFHHLEMMWRHPYVQWYISKNKN